MNYAFEKYLNFKDLEVNFENKKYLVDGNCLVYGTINGEVIQGEPTDVPYGEGSVRYDDGKEYSFDQNSIELEAFDPGTLEITEIKDENGNPIEDTFLFDKLSITLIDYIISDYYSDMLEKIDVKSDPVELDDVELVTPDDYDEDDFFDLEWE